jgi:hypothetical protein
MRLLVLAAVAAAAAARISTLSVSDDSRTLIEVETFGFLAGGDASLRLSNFRLVVHSHKADAPRAAFLLRKVRACVAARRVFSLQLHVCVGDACSHSTLVARPARW